MTWAPKAFEYLRFCFFANSSAIKYLHAFQTKSGILSRFSQVAPSSGPDQRRISPPSDTAPLKTARCRKKQR